jgi:hypothetical protein
LKSMVTREDVLIEVRKLPEEYLGELYQIIKDFEARIDGEDADQNVMAALRQIKISASSNFLPRRTSKNERRKQEHRSSTRFV